MAIDNLEQALKLVFIRCVEAKFDAMLMMCMRCPQVVTANYNPSEAMRLTADPRTPTT